MTLESSLAFVLAVFLFAATPGPAILACTAQAMGPGFRSALALAAGIVVGDVIFLLVAIYGLAFIATILEGLFVVVRVVGGAYLIWMGWRMWSAGAVASESQAAAGRQGFRAGLLLTLGNPKVIVFYMGFLPAFMDLSALSGWQVVWVAALLVAVLIAVNSAYAWMASRATGWIDGVIDARRIHRGAGSVLVATGAFVVFKQ